MVLCVHKPSISLGNFAPDRLFEESEEVLQKNIEGHRAYVKAFHPDFIKLTSDGYFTLPYPEIREIHTAADLSRIKSGHAEEWTSKRTESFSDIPETITGNHSLKKPAWLFAGRVLNSVRKKLKLFRLIQER